MRTVYHYGSEVVGYLKKAQNLDLLVVRYYLTQKLI